MLFSVDGFFVLAVVTPRKEYMSEPKQLSLLDKQPPVQKQVQYLPPNTEVFEQLAEQVCATLGEVCQSAHQDAEVVEGLTAFLTVIAHLTATAATNGKAYWLKQERSTKQTLKRNMRCQ